MKFGGKPAEPKKPEAPNKYIDYTIKFSVYNGCSIFDFKSLKKQMEYSWNPSVSQYFDDNLDKVTLNKEHRGYDDYESMYLELFIPKESKIFEDQYYKNKVAVHEKQFSEYPDKLKKYTEDLKIWEKKKSEADKKKKQKEIEAARKLLKDLGEL